LFPGVVRHDFGQDEGGPGEQIGGGMRVGVEFLVGGGRAEAEVGAEVNDALAGGEERAGIFGGDTVREGEK